MSDPDRPAPSPPGSRKLPAWLLALVLPSFLLSLFILLTSAVEALRPGGSTDPLNLLLVSALAFPLAVLLGLRLDPDRTISPTEALGLAPVRAPVAGLAILFGVFAVLPLSEIDNVLEHWLPRSEEERTAMLRILAFDGWFGQLAKVTAIAVVTPLGEEAIFRGILLRRLAAVHGPSIGIVGSALVFALAHLSPRLILPIGFLGGFLGWITWRSRSILPAVATHAAYNAVPFLLAPSVEDLPGLVPDEGPSHLPPEVVVITLLLCIATAVGLARMTRGGGKGRR
jgi:membrane protease YdiL (CAAX protease family)